MKRLMEVQTHSDICNHMPLVVRLFVVKGESNFEVSAENFDFEILQSSGNLVKVPPRLLADKTSIMFDNRKLTLKLYQNPTQSCTGDYGFQVNASWLGHGEGVFIIPTPFPISDSSQIDAVALQVEPVSQTDFSISIVYVDEVGNMRGTSATLLGPLLDAAIPILA